MAHLRLSTCDIVTAPGDSFYIEHVNECSIHLRPLSGEGEQLVLTHQDLADLIDKSGFAIKYGYFHSRQVARRAQAGRTLVDKLPTSEKRLVFVKQLYCETLLEALNKGETSRSDAAYSSFRATLHQRVMQQLQQILRKSDQFAYLATALTLPAPSRGAVMGWLRAWEGTRDPMSLVRKSIFNGKNAPRLNNEREGIFEHHLSTYLSPAEISVSQLHRNVNADIRERNKFRQVSGLPELAAISESTIRRRVDELDEFEVMAARKGVAEAKNLLGAHTGGLDVPVPLMRAEIDEWQIDLLAIIAKAGVDISDESLRDLAIGRYYICVAMDVATRCVLGLKLSSTQSTEAAKSVLWMAMRDKTEIARQLGCETPWRTYGHIHHVAVDNGPAFINPDFKAAVSDLGIGYSVMPAGVPKLRARIERLFGTFVKMLMPELTGRTFSDPKSRGDYPSEKYTVHTAESIVEILVRFIVDIYHNRSHRGLQEASPNNTWDKLCNTYGWSHPQCVHTLRHALGITLKRTSGRHGILVCGINYHGPELDLNFRKFGGQELEIRVDPEDLGHISVWLEDAWHTLPAMMDGVEGVPFALWESMMFDLRQSNRDATAIDQEMMDRAMARIRELDAEQRALRRLGPVQVSASDIRRAEHETFLGLKFNSGATTSLSQDEDLLSDTLSAIASAPAPHDPEVAQPESTFENWSFIDEDE